MKTKHSTYRRRILHLGLTICISLGLLGLTGCDDDDDFDHDPPPGQGSMIVDNHTDDDLSVYINGNRVYDVNEDDARAYDLDPGVYRVVLEQQGGDRQFRDDIDILVNRQTILDVYIDATDVDDYEVHIRFD